MRIKISIAQGADESDADFEVRRQRLQNWLDVGQWPTRRLVNVSPFDTDQEEVRSNQENWWP